MSVRPINWIGTCICKRRHDNVGYAPSNRATAQWACWPCLSETTLKGTPIIKKVFQMSRKELDSYETLSLESAGEAAGEYLDSLGVTDVAALEPEQWREFWKRGLLAYEKAMRDLLTSIPF